MLNLFLMKRSLLFLMAFGVLFLTGCSKDDEVPINDQSTDEKPLPDQEKPEEPESLVYFRFIDKGIYSDGVNLKRWVALHNSDGEFLDYAEILPGEELVFESEGEPLAEEITVTIIGRFTFGDGAKSSFVDTYVNVDTGSSWSIETYDSPVKTGEFTFSMTNLPEWNSYVIDSGDSWERTGGSRYQEPDVEPGALRADRVEIRAEEDFVFALSDNQGKIKYMDVPGVSAGDSITVDASNLIDFDSTVTIDFPESYNFGVDVAARYMKNGLLNDLDISPTSFGLDETITSLEMGYLNRFDTYESSIYYSTDNFRYNYSKIGTPITGFEFPSAPSFDLTDDSPENFAFTTDATFKYQSVQFVAEEPPGDGGFGFSRNRTFWSVYSPAGGHHTWVTLPDELLTESDIYINDIRYQGTTLSIKSLDYKAYLEQRFLEGRPNEINRGETEYFAFFSPSENTAKRARKYSLHSENGMTPYRGELSY